ncbi:MAG: hypothetical protein N3G21_08860 [Candidatus Hydrogenedentes bacterium]|nr:hypothetical protein [Candidatus Hydrogenedentota bacterium]
MDCGFTSSDRFSIFCKALRVQDEARGYGFEWLSVEGIIEKIREELLEIEREISQTGSFRLKKEIGDLYMVALHLAQYLNLDPLECLEISCNIFEKRWRKVLDRINTLPEDRIERLEYLESIWQSIKDDE